MTELEPRAGETLERQLDRFARVRLDPSAAQAKRARSTVMEAAWRQRLGGAPASAVRDARDDAGRAASMPVRSAGATNTRAGLYGGWGARRLGASFAAAILAGLVVGSSVFAASRAGGPLYGPRLALEQLALPAAGQARLEGELALAQVRLADIVDGSARGDMSAVAAAVQAYLASLDDLETATGNPADRALLVVQAHRAVLLAVLDQVPESARAGIENALERSSMVVERLDAAGSPAAGPRANSGGGNGGGNPNAGPGANNGGGNPNAGPGANNGGGRPDATLKPARTPKPAKTPPPTTEPGAAATDTPRKGGPRP